VQVKSGCEGLSLAGPPRSGATSRLGSMDPVAEQDQVRAAMVARKARRSHGQEPVQGSSSRPQSTRGVCDGSPQNRRVTWLSHKTKTRGSAGRDGIRTRREASMPGDTRWDCGACVRRTRTAAKV
jgi:hypothetical protein